MSEILNLSALCRCCHADGCFKSLQQPYIHRNVVEIYSTMLQETLGISIDPPPFEASHAICDECIVRLRDANRFRQQVIDCEKKFAEYCLNEVSVSGITFIKIEEEDDISKDNEDKDKKCILSSNKVEVDIKCDNSSNGDGFDDDRMSDVDDTQNSENVKQEDDKDTKSGIKKEKVPKTGKSKSRGALKSKSEKIKMRIKNCSKFRCKVCQKGNQKKTDLLRHVEETHKDGPFNCEGCGVKKHTYQALDNHTSLCKMFKCRYCDAAFKKRPLRSQHEKEVHTKKLLFICDICQKEFAYKNSIKKHLLWHSGLNKPCCCDTCGNYFTDKSNLKIHIDTVHFKIRKYACSICDQRFSLKKHMKHHFLLKHEGIKPNACKLCDARFSYWNALAKHIRIAHGDNSGEKKNYECKFCPETFAHRGEFRAHVNKHAKKGHLPHTCHICGKNFATNYTLQRHIEAHSGVKRYKCDICDQGFVQKGQISRHKKTVHNPEANAVTKTQCTICKVHVRDLEKHLEKCHMDRPHACHLCPKTYPEKNALNTHIRHFHLGYRIHPCSVCVKSYSRPDALRRHMLVKHKLQMKHEVSDNCESGDVKNE